jgi:hypothetical protein
VDALFEWQNLIYGIALLFAAALVVGSAFGLDADGTDSSVDAGEGSAATASDHASMLALLGIGKVPLSVFLTTLLFAFGGAGLCVNALLTRWLEASLARGLVSLVVAATIAILAARSVAKLVARYVPSVESYATEKADVLGTIGIAETSIGQTFGVALVTDSTGSLMQLKCRTQSGPIEKGHQVLVVDYDPTSDFYLVDSWESEPHSARSNPKGGVR